MRMSQDEKVISYRRIVGSASRLYRQNGLDGASVADVMSDAGMTHGGFYKHFGSKEDLIERALDSAFCEFVTALGRGDPQQAVAAYRSLYLSREHMSHPAKGCPVASIGAEVARGSDSLKKTFGAGVRRVIDSISRVGKGSAASRRDAALREFSMMVGAIIIARASDTKLADDVLRACRRETPDAR